MKNFIHRNFWHGRKAFDFTSEGPQLLDVWDEINFNVLHHVIRNKIWTSQFNKTSISPGLVNFLLLKCKLLFTIAPGIVTGLTSCWTSTGSRLLTSDSINLQFLKIFIIHLLVKTLCVHTLHYFRERVRYTSYLLWLEEKGTRVIRETSSVYFRFGLSAVRTSVVWYYFRATRMSSLLLLLLLWFRAQQKNLAARWMAQPLTAVLRFLRPSTWTKNHTISIDFPLRSHKMQTPR